MNRILELTQKRAALWDEADAILKLAETEKRALTPEEAASIDGKKVEMEALARTIAAARGVEALRPDPGEGGSARREPVEIRDLAEDKPFAGGLGEFLQCVRTAAIQPGATDPRLQARAALGLNEKVGSEGGFLVGKDMSAEMLADMHDAEILAPLCTEVPISQNSNGVTINGVDETSRADGSRFGGVQAYWADEAGTATATKPKFRRIELKLKKLLAFYYATDEEIQDASVLEALASAAFAEEIAFKVDDAIIRGSGAGMPLGILNSGSLVSVAKETGQLAGTILYENILKMESRMPARSQLRAEWFVNVNCMPQLRLMTVQGGTAATPVFLPPNGAAGAPFGTLLGKAIRPNEQCSSVGTQGDIILADWKQYRLATKGGLQQAQSIHVQFLTGEQVFRFAYRVDGQPARAKPLTPFKGTETQGPFVVIDTR